MGERNVAAPAAGELIAQKVADRIRDLTQLPPVMQGAGVVAIQADLRAAIDLALAPAEPARGEVTPAPELADKLSQMAAAIGAWDDDPIMLTDFLCEIGARALLWEAMARITETATLTERLARAEGDVEVDREAPYCGLRPFLYRALMEAISRAVIVCMSHHDADMPSGAWVVNYASIVAGAVGEAQRIERAERAATGGTHA